MQVAFLPWMIYWITFDIPSVSKWVSVGLPLLLSALIVGYRLKFNKPTWLEVGGMGFFALAGLLVLIGHAGFAVWGSVISSVVMACLWLGTLLSPPGILADEPLSAAYSKWGYIKALWRHSMFIYPNALITLMWGWQFIVAALFGVAAILLPAWHLIFTVLRYLLLVPAFIFTAVYQKRAMELRIRNYEATMDRLGFWASMGLLVASGLLLGCFLPPR